MAMLRLLAISLLCGAVAVPFLGEPRGDGFEHARYAVLVALVIGQVVTVPIGSVAGLVLAATGSWPRTPGYVLGSVTTACGVVVAAQARAASRWIDGSPPGLRDPEDSSLAVAAAFLSGAFTICLGISLVVMRWSGYDPRTAPVRRGRTPRRRPRTP
ncbi:hypothetical protein HD597_010246 [Nonomuraea thailandensis]|uniref:Uncharacterized protein n=1 Tax=Nonomuraea thailandensis TaxID=1188745 RepID=A0A9X2GWU8_9ACTN|nr:hypothetical protein [Nonomuraea thailandensis]MCP2363226.1 hypothetical protein [Nonomuraea thailandensis]